MTVIFKELDKVYKCLFMIVKPLDLDPYKLQI